MGNDKLRLNQLQVLKLISFLVIYTWHSRNYLPGFQMGSIGHAAVNLFFFCSGITSVYSKLDRPVKAFTFKNVASDIWRRVKALYPLYFTVLMVSVLLSDIPRDINLHYYEGLADELIRLVPHLLLLQSWFPSVTYDYNAVGWFISTLMFLYIFTIPFMKVMQKLRNKPKTLAILIVVFSIGCGLLQISAPLLGIDDNSGHFFPPFRVPQYFLGMLMGTLIRYIKDNETTYNKKSWTVFEVISFVIWIGLGIIKPENIFVLELFRIVPSIIILIVISLGRGYLTVLFNKPLPQKLSSVTFECYIIHTVLNSISGWLIGISEFSKLGNAFMFCFNLFLTFLIAFALHGGSGSKKPQAKATPLPQNPA